MDELVGAIATAALFFSYIAYCETKELLLSSPYRTSLGRARVGALVAAGFAMALWLLLCQAFQTGGA